MRHGPGDRGLIPLIGANQAAGDGRVLIPMPAGANAVMAVGDGKRDPVCGIAPHQQHRRHLLSLLHFLEVAGDVRIVFVQKMGLAGAQKVLGMMPGDGRVAKGCHQPFRLCRREEQSEIGFGRFKVLLSGAGSPQMGDLFVFLLHRAEEWNGLPALPVPAPGAMLILWPLGRTVCSPRKAWARLLPRAHRTGETCELHSP